MSKQTQANSDQRISSLLGEFAFHPVQIRFTQGKCNQIWRALREFDPNSDSYEVFDYEFRRTLDYYNLMSDVAKFKEISFDAVIREDDEKQASSPEDIFEDSAENMFENLSTNLNFTEATVEEQEFAIEMDLLSLITIIKIFYKFKISKFQEE